MDFYSLLLLVLFVSTGSTGIIKVPFQLNSRLQLFLNCIFFLSDLRNLSDLPIVKNLSIRLRDRGNEASDTSCEKSHSRVVLHKYNELRYQFKTMK